MEHNHSAHMGHMDHDHSAHMGHMDHMDHMNHDHSASASQAAMDPSNAHAHHGPGSFHLMQMSFHFGYNETVLLEEWKITSYASLISSMIGIFVLATLYEGLKCYRAYLSWRVLKSQDYHAIRAPGEANNEVKEASSAEASIGSHRVSDPNGERNQMPRWFHCLQTVLHILQVTISMLLMLVFMTYNVWLCASVIAGAGTGYFLFGWRRYMSSPDLRSHCH